MTPKTLRGGMVGAGAWSRLQLAAWAQVKGAEIVALCDRHPDRRTPIIERFNIREAFDDMETMVDEAGLDFVDICTRPYSHAPLIRLAVGRGLSVLCQKPFCTSLGEARELVDLCRNTKTRLMINENYRWQSSYRRAKQHLDEGLLGQPFLARIYSRAQITFPEFTHPQAYLADMPHLILYELGTHFLDVTRFLFGEPDSVYARLHRISPAVIGEDVMVVELGYKGLTCQIDASWASIRVPDAIEQPILQIEGTEGTLVLRRNGVLHVICHSESRQWLLPELGSDEDRDLMAAVATQQHFIDSLNSGSEFETGGAETLKTMTLVYGCYRSAELGQVVKIHDAEIVP